MIRLALLLVLATTSVAQPVAGQNAASRSTASAAQNSPPPHLALEGVTPAAQEPPPPHLTLQDAIARAEAESHRLAEAAARQEIATASTASRRAAELPTVSVTGGYTRTNHVDEFGVPQPNGVLRVIYPDIPDNYFTRAVVQWPIYTAGRTDALIRAAEAEARAATADIEATRADLRLEVTRTYWALATAAQSVRVVAAAVERAAAHLRDIRSRFDQGFVPPNEVASAEAQHARQQMQLIEATNLQRGVAEDLRRLTGVPGDVSVDSLSRSEPGSAPGPGGGARVRAAADERPVHLATDPQPPPNVRPEIQAANERIQAAAERLAAVRAGRKPTVGFTAATDYANPNPRIFPRAGRWQTSWEVGVAATWTVWDGGRVGAEAADAEASVRAIRARQAELESLFRSEIRQRELDLASARAVLEAADVGVRSAAEARRVVAERFAAGVITSTEVLDAELALLQADLDRTRAMANIRLAEARLARAAGR